jgi:hypothetical protein
MEWKVIDGFEKYEDSNTGEVRNINTQVCLELRKKVGYNSVYLINDFKRSSMYVHRLVALAFLENPKELVDHKDGNKINNMVSNLRWASKKENAQNSKMPKDNKSGVKGVSWAKRDRKWNAYITVDGIRMSLGNFSEIEDARQARILAVQKAFGEFVHASERNPQII